MLLYTTPHPRLKVRQISLLTSFELLTIPPPTTASPFHHDRFGTLLHRRGLPRRSPWETYKRPRDFPVTRSRVRTSPGVSPTGLAESSSYSYGLVIHLRLLSTFSHENAVTTVGYRPVTLAW